MEQGGQSMLRTEHEPVWSIDLNTSNLYLHPQFDNACFTPEIFNYYDKRPNKEDDSFFSLNVDDLLEQARENPINSLLYLGLHKTLVDWYRDKPIINGKQFEIPRGPEAQQFCFLQEKIFNTKDGHTSVLTADNELNYYFLILAHQGVMQAGMETVAFYGNFAPEIRPGDASNIIATVSNKNKIVYVKEIPVALVRGDHGEITEKQTDGPVFVLKTTLAIEKTRDDLQYDYHYSITVYCENLKPIFEQMFSPLYALIDKLNKLTGDVNFQFNQEGEASLHAFVRRFTESYPDITESELVENLKLALPQNDLWKAVTVLARLNALIKELQKSEEADYVFYLTALHRAVHDKYGTKDSFSRLIRRSSSQLFNGDDGEDEEKTDKLLQDINRAIDDLIRSEEDKLCRKKLVKNLLVAISSMCRVNKSNIEKISKLLSREDVSYSLFKDALRGHLYDYIGKFIASTKNGNVKNKLKEKLDTLLKEMKICDEETGNYLLIALLNAAFSKDLYQFLEIGFDYNTQTRHSLLRNRYLKHIDDPLLFALDSFKDAINRRIRQDSQRLVEINTIWGKYKIALEKTLKVEMQKEATLLAREQELELKLAVNALLDENSELSNHASAALKKAAEKYHLIINLLQYEMFNDFMLSANEKLKKFDDNVKKYAEKFDEVDKKFLSDINNIGKIVVKIQQCCKAYKFILAQIIFEEISHYKHCSKFYKIDISEAAGIDTTQLDIDQIVDLLLYGEVKHNQEKESEEVDKLRAWASSKAKLQLAVKKYNVVTNKLLKDCLKNEELQTNERKLLDFRQIFNENIEILSINMDSVDRRFFYDLFKLLTCRYGLSNRYNAWSLWQSPDVKFISEINLSLAEDLEKIETSSPSSLTL